MPIDWKKYPKDWKSITLKIKKRAKWCCELCKAKHNEPHPITNSKVCITTHHINGDIYNNNGYNLLALCQRCHLRIDLPKHLENRTVNDNPMRYDYKIGTRLHKIHFRKLEILNINKILINIDISDSKILICAGNHVIEHSIIDKSPNLITPSTVLWFTYREDAEKAINAVGSILE